MNKKAFIEHLRNSVKWLIDFTGNYCYNSFVENYSFLIVPSGTDYHAGMDTFAKKNLDEMLHFKGKFLNEDELINLLYVEDRIPNWIDISIYKSDSKITLIYVMATREWRLYTEAEADFPVMEIFHAQVSLPSNYEKDPGKFDVNWKYDKENTAEHK